MIPDSTARTSTRLRSKRGPPPRRQPRWGFFEVFTKLALAGAGFARNAGVLTEGEAVSRSLPRLRPAASGHTAKAARRSSATSSSCRLKTVPPTRSCRGSSLPAPI